jgi:Uma2 family endonuclease
MSSLATALVTFEEFMRLPDPADGERYELHNGEVVLVPAARPAHIAAQGSIADLLGAMKQFGFVVQLEYPYRPTANYQFWYADVALYPADVRAEMFSWDQYKTYAPPLMVEVLSPSNTASKIAEQRIACMSNGTREFWVVDVANRTVHVTDDTGAVRLYRSGESINVLGLMPIDISAIFASLK